MQKFDTANLTDKEKKIRNEAIEMLFNHLAIKHPLFTKKEVEELYDKMQQASIEAGHAAWEFYKKKQD